MTQRGGFFARPEPGKIMNRAWRAPTNSRPSGSRRPTCDSSPDSSAGSLKLTLPVSEIES